MEWELFVIRYFLLGYSSFAEQSSLPRHLGEIPKAKRFGIIPQIQNCINFFD